MPASITPESPFWTVDEAYEYLRFSSPHALRQGVKRYGIPHIRRGDRIFFIKSQLDEFMKVASEATKQPRRRRRKKD